MRRAAILVAAMALFAVAATSASAAPLLWVVNNVKDNVATIDTATGAAVGAPIPVGGLPESIAITPNGRVAFVASYEGEDVTVLDTVAHAAVASIPLPDHPEQIAISPDGKTAYVTVEGSKEVTVIETATDKIVGTVSVAAEASAIAFAPDGRHAYVSSGEKAVEVVDTATGKVVGPPIPVGEAPQSIVFTPNGTTAYVSGGGSKTVTVINTALGQAVGSISIVGDPGGMAVGPSGQRLYVTDELGGTVSVYETEGGRMVGKPIVAGNGAKYVAITPDGKTAYVSAPGGEAVTPIVLATGEALKPIAFVGEPADLAVTPDQSPTAAFTAPSAIAAFPVGFSGAASTDPDGTVVGWNWSFGDGATATGVAPTNTYAAPGTYATKLSVIDNEGCGEAEVFTGRTAYCSGNPAAAVTHPVTVAAPPIVCSSRFGIGRAVHDRHNGTVRLQVRLPAAGSLFLFGKKVHAVTRKSMKAGSTFLTLHARVRVNKQLKKTHRTGVRYRVTFFPAAGCSPVTVHRSVALLRAPRKKHRTAN